MSAISSSRSPQRGHARTSRDERRDDGGTPEQHRRQLKAKRLARSDRHHRQHIVPLEPGAHNVALARREGEVPEMSPERFDHVDHVA